MRKHAAGTNVSRKSLRWDWRLEANLNRKANGLALEGLLWDFTYLCWNLTYKQKRGLQGVDLNESVGRTTGTAISSDAKPEPTEDSGDNVKEPRTGSDQAPTDMSSRDDRAEANARKQFEKDKATITKRVGPAAWLEVAQAVDRIWDQESFRFDINPETEKPFDNIDDFCDYNWGFDRKWASHQRVGLRRYEHIKDELPSGVIPSERFLRGLPVDPALQTTVVARMVREKKRLTCANLDKILHPAPPPKPPTPPPKFPDRDPSVRQTAIDTLTALDLSQEQAQYYVDQAEGTTSGQIIKNALRQRDKDKEVKPLGDPAPGQGWDKEEKEATPGRVCRFVAPGD